MRILIAEDDPTSRRLLDIILTKWGFEVISTCDGDEAWTELQKKDSPNLVILDWMMPGSSGVEVCKKIRKSDLQKTKYIILLTALGSEDNIIQGLESGADDYISKPYNKNELRVRIGVGERIVRLQQTLQNQIAEIQQAENRLKTLNGLLPICTHCRKIQNEDEDNWESIEDYLNNSSDVELNHTVCPECEKKHENNAV